jgi:hypothetical protein
MKAFVALIAALLVAMWPMRSPHWVERVRTVPHLRHFDIVIVGGTPGGIAAAIAAARHGMRVALLTNSSVLGGQLTRGMLTQWDLQDAPDGTDLQSGIFHEFYDALPDGFNVVAAAKYFRQRIRAARNVTWITGARNLRVYGTRDRALRRVSSIGDIAAPCFIDATDDARMAAAAGAPADVGEQDQGKDLAMQPATLIFTLAGVNWKQLDPDGGNQAAGYADVLSGYEPLSRRAAVPDANFQLNADGTVMVNAIDVFGVDGRSRRSVREARAIAVAESEHLLPFLRREIPGFEHARIARFASDLYIRETRHVGGLVWIDGNYIWNGEQPYDTVVRAAYPMDVHPVRPGATGGDGWLEVPRVYGIPLRALIPRGFRNLAVVGPSISATHDAAGSVRVMPTTIGEGEAAGDACALARLRGVDLRDIALSRSLVARVRAILHV